MRERTAHKTSGNTENKASETDMKNENILQEKRKEPEQEARVNLGGVPLFSVIGRVGSSKGEIIVDTGSQITLIDPSACEGTLEPLNIAIVGMGSQPVQSLGATKVEVALEGCCPFQVEAAVCALSGGALMLLGCDVLSERGAVLDVQKKSVKLSREPNGVQAPREGEIAPKSIYNPEVKINSVYAVLKEEVVIPPGSAAILPLEARTSSGVTPITKTVPRLETLNKY
uniref:Retroviral-like aspartic protease 1 n=1 Tax=Lygus hesperus TaxID=30085 RepID=A0A0A9YY51_LYGHE